MATLNPVIVPAKALKGGRHKIRISVAHNGETRYIVTEITIDSAKEFKNGSIVKRPDATILNTKLRGLLMDYQDTIDSLKYVNGLSCSELVFQIKNYGGRRNMTMGALVKEYLGNASIKPSTQRIYKSTWNVLSKHINATTLVENINYAMLLNLQRTLKHSKVSNATMRNYFSFLSTIFSYARKCSYVGNDFRPTSGLALPKVFPRQAWLTVEEVRNIRDAPVTDSYVKRCRDMFMLSYYLGGINVADLAKINFRKQNITLKYIRTKTEDRPKLNKYVEFDIPKEAREIIDRCTGEDGYIVMSDSERKNSLHQFFDTHLQKLARAANIGHLIYYSARKSFSQHAFLLGVPTPVIDYILGHRIDKEGSCLFNYIGVTSKMATDAVRLVIDNLNTCKEEK